MDLDGCRETDITLEAPCSLGLAELPCTSVDVSLADTPSVEQCFIWGIGCALFVMTIELRRTGPLGVELRAGTDRGARSSLSERLRFLSKRYSPGDAGGAIAQ